MCEVYKLSIYYSLNRYYVHAIYETLKKQKLIICVPLPQNITPQLKNFKIIVTIYLLTHWPELDMDGSSLLQIVLACREAGV